MRNEFVAILVTLSFAGMLLSAEAPNPTRRHLGVAGKHFVLDGKPFQIISGEMHYARVPREYWRERLRMARAMGLNTVSTYVFWNVHEPRPGIYDFSGNRDVAAFIHMAQAEGLQVILRPGPYSCAEWELGGYPAWLLRDPDVVLRSNDPRFMEPATRWIARLGKELANLQIGHGGPIIAVQVENEYGSFGQDKVYLARIRDAFKSAGFHDALLYTADGPEELPRGTLPDLPAVVNLGPGDAEKGLATLEKFRPDSPLMIGEYWDGWFDHWGRPHHTTKGQNQAEVKEIGWLLEHGHSINFYMFHGGTTWDFMNGANSDGPDDYWPDTTSYDYSAALDESGRPTEKYFLFRQLIAQHTGKYLPDVPNLPKAIQIPEFCLNQSAPLFANLPQPTRSDQPLTMESLGQSYGYILYRTQIAGPGSGNLDINVRDYAAIYVDGRLAGTLDRRLNESRLPLRIAEPKTRLDILVENMGRVNFGQALRSERKGIASVFWNGKEVTGWEIFSLPMDDLSSLRFGMTGPGPTFYRGTFDLAETGDTFLDLGSWSKGTVWVNGHHLGRFWSIGPQQTLYVPGPWLKHENNEVVVFAGRLQSKPVMRGLSRPVLDDLREPHPALKKQTSK